MEGALEASRLLHGSRVRRAQLSERLLGSCTCVQGSNCSGSSSGPTTPREWEWIGCEYHRQGAKGEWLWTPARMLLPSLLPLSKRQEGIDYGSAYQKEASPKRREKLHD
jgi:hypothetical protein